MRNLQVETDLHYFTDSWGFDENFKVLPYGSFSKTSICLYTNYGNNSDEYDIEQDCIIEDSKRNKTLIKRYLTKSGYYCHSELYGNLDELITDIGGVDYSNIDELEDVLDEIGIPHTSNYIRMSTRGYSQGDYAEILVNVAEYEKVGGGKFNSDGMQKWFDHYFWDSPIGGTIGISFDQTMNCVPFEFCEEFEFNEFTNDEYDVDGLEVEGLINYIKGEVKVPLNDEEIEELRVKLKRIDYTDVTYPRCGC